MLPVALQVAAAFSPHWSFKMRAVILIAPLALATYLAYALTAFKGNGSVVGACAVVLTGVLFGRRPMIVMLVALLLAPMVVGAAMVSGALGLDESNLSAHAVLPWVRTTF